MHLLSTLLSVASLASLETLAAPSPKIPSVRWPEYAKHTSQRRSINITSDFPAPSLNSSKANIFAALSSDEARSVIQFLHEKAPELNLTNAVDAGEWDNSITLVDFIQPNKTLALEYLDGNGTAPARFAKVAVMFSACDEPFVQDLIVGPLPVSEETTYSSLDWTTTSGSSKIRNYDADASRTEEFKIEIFASVEDIMLDLLNGTYGKELSAYGIDPLWREYPEDGSPMKVISWQGVMRVPIDKYNSDSILPQGLWMKLNIAGRDPSKWEMMGWLYNNVFYSSTADFRAAWETEGFEKIDINYDSVDYFTDRVGTPFLEDAKAPPISIQPEGQRFGVDVAERFVEWEDFSFFISFTKDTGMRLYDIRYKSERIIYELALQEAVAHYSGNDPVQSGTSYLDSFYGFGAYTFELLPGIDCPTYSTFLDTAIHVSETTLTHPSAICLFEQDMGYPISRHTASSYLYSTKARRISSFLLLSFSSDCLPRPSFFFNQNIALTVRTIATIGNYDYMQSYIFYADGSIETVVQASGYIQAAHYAHNGDYGYKIHDALSGSMHDHVLNWKIDFDILGTKNSLAKHTFVNAEEKYVWSNTTRTTMKLERRTLQTEDEGKFNWVANGQTAIIVENSDEQNKYGENRGYKVMPSRGGAGAHLTIQDSPNLKESGNFAKHHLYVTRRKDSEPQAAHPNNAFDPGFPIVNFDKFFDGESIVQEDIVIWANLGMHHAPHTGDLPNTVFNTASAAFMISPHNYLESDPSRASRQKVEITFNSTSGKVTDVDDSGLVPYAATFDLSSTDVDYTQYTGDSLKRKWPFDPLTAFDNATSASS
ncbi:copper amine oxidase [Mrakia frigida]|uniref:copper amine oxidase n=1 Tax=Mrakia frigida TaxID=29902 RepID=UPI003FCC1FAA